MTKPLVDVRGLLRGLHDHGVQYLVFGALAMAFYGYVRNSEDLDIVVDPDRENIKRLTGWLQSIDAVPKFNPKRRFGPREQWAMQKGSNATVLTSLGQVDIVQQLPGLPEWKQLFDEAEIYEVEGQTIHVMNRATLIELKRRRGSNLDLADIDAIGSLDKL